MKVETCTATGCFAREVRLRAARVLGMLTSRRTPWNASSRRSSGRGGTRFRKSMSRRKVLKALERRQLATRTWSLDLRRRSGHHTNSQPIFQESSKLSASSLQRPEQLKRQLPSAIALPERGETVAVPHRAQTLGVLSANHPAIRRHLSNHRLTGTAIPATGWKPGGRVGPTEITKWEFVGQQWKQAQPRVFYCISSQLLHEYWPAIAMR